MGKKTPKTKSKKNKKVKKPVYIGLDENGEPPEFEYVRQASSEIHNTGLFAAKAIPKDGYVIQYLGERISKKESNNRGLGQHDKSLVEDVGAVYIFELDKKYDIDGNFPWNTARLANHSCSPNCESQNIDDEIWFVAIEDIAQGDELTFDYGYGLEHWAEHPCRCGSENCAGYIVRSEDRKKLRKLIKKNRIEQPVG